MLNYALGPKVIAIASKVRHGNPTFVIVELPELGPRQNKLLVVEGYM